MWAPVPVPVSVPEPEPNLLTLTPSHRWQREYSRNRSGLRQWVSCFHTAQPMFCLPTQPQASPLYTGFNSWNRWHCWVDEHKLKETADQLVHLGLAAAGYRHINIVRLLCFFLR